MDRFKDKKSTFVITKYDLETNKMHLKHAIQYDSYTTAIQLTRFWICWLPTTKCCLWSWYSMEYVRRIEESSSLHQHVHISINFVVYGPVYDIVSNTQANFHMISANNWLHKVKRSNGYVAMNVWISCLAPTTTSRVEEKFSINNIMWACVRTCYLHSIPKKDLQRDDNIYSLFVYCLLNFNVRLNHTYCHSHCHGLNYRSSLYV